MDAVWRCRSALSRALGLTGAPEIRRRQMRGTLIVLAAAHAKALVLTSRTRVPIMMVTTSTITETEAKRAWLSRLETPTWGRGGAAPAEAPVAPDTVATMSAEEAKKAWLARLDTPTWGKATREDEAKKAWLARLDAPTWGKAAAVIADVAKDASAVEEATDECAIGVIEQCNALSREDAAKKAWLASLDVPSWGAAALAMSAVASVSAEIAQEKEPAMSAEEIAKHQWLAKLDKPAWGAKSQMAKEEEAKRAWLARLDAPSWGKAAKAMVKVVQEASAIHEMTEACDQGDDAACESLSHEEEAKKAWLARLDVPAWGAAAAAVSAVATQVGA